MPTDKDLVPMLQKRRLELLKELHAIEILLNADSQAGSNDAPQPTTKAGPAKVTTTVYESGSLGYRSTRDENIAALKEKTEDVTWKNYILKAVELLGPVNTDGIVDLINDANDKKIPDQRVKQAASNSLRELLDEKKIEKKKGDANDGYLYFVGEQKPQ